MYNLVADLRHAVRNLAHARVAILTLALGIGATTAMFSVVNAVLLQPLPYRHPEQLVAINEFDNEHGVPEVPESNLSYPDYRDVAARNRSFQAVAPYTFVEYTVDWLALDLGCARFQAILLVIFAGMALLLTAIGLYGVIAYSVTERTHEIGVRMALGASRTKVLSMMLGRGVQLTVLGVALGVAGALALARVMASLLYEVPARDPATYVVVCVVLGAVALLASYIPALRAARTDPMVALRYE